MSTWTVIFLKSAETSFKNFSKSSRYVISFSLREFSLRIQIKILMTLIWRPVSPHYLHLRWKRGCIASSDFWKTKTMLPRWIISSVRTTSLKWGELSWKLSIFISKIKLKSETRNSRGEKKELRMKRKESPPSIQRVTSMTHYKVYWATMNPLLVRLTTWTLFCLHHLWWYQYLSQFQFQSRCPWLLHLLRSRKRRRKRIKRTNPSLHPHSLLSNQLSFHRKWTPMLPLKAMGTPRTWSTKSGVEPRFTNSLPRIRETTPTMQERKKRNRKILLS